MTQADRNVHLKRQLKDARFAAKERLECLRAEKDKSYRDGYNDARREFTNQLRALVGVDAI